MKEEKSERMSTLKELRRVCSFFRHLVAADLQHDHRYIIRLQAIQTALPLIQHIVISQCLQEKVPSTSQFPGRLISQLAELIINFTTIFYD